MKVITQRDLIRRVSEAWAEQYRRYPAGDKKRIGAELAALDPETATAAQVNAIIGNDSWTEKRCDECGERVSAVVQVGQEPDYESSTAELCLPCTERAYRLISATSDKVRQEVEALRRRLSAYNEPMLGAPACDLWKLARDAIALLRRLSQPAPTSETVLRAAAKVYMGCVHALSEFVPGKQVTYFEASPTKDEECCNRWLALNEAGKVLKAAIEASATPPPPAGSRGTK